jgi:hypothetical protein
MWKQVESLYSSQKNTATYNEAVKYRKKFRT